MAEPPVFRRVRWVWGCWVRLYDLVLRHGTWANAVRHKFCQRISGYSDSAQRFDIYRNVFYPTDKLQARYGAAVQCERGTPAPWECCAYRWLCGLSRASHPGGRE